MTIKELYDWACKNSVEDFEIEIQYRDSGGYYYGTDSDIVPEIYANEEVVVL